MATRGSSRAQSSRPPLGDATERTINASPQKLQKSQKPKRTSNHHVNPLRAHPVTTARDPRSADSRPVSTASSRQGAPPVNPRTSTISHEEAADKRVSQISTSSNTSAGKRKTHIGPWQLGKTLGKGSAARVRLARHHGTQELAAVKILSKNACHLTQAGSLAELDKWDRKREEYTSENHMPLSIEREVAILKLIDHPNIMKLYDIWENRSEIYLVLEYVEQGDLFEYINRTGPIAENETMFYFRQILSGLEYCHSFNICHRDLKPENILLKQGGQIKIADFGMAAIQQSPSHMLKTSCGSPHYAAPELVSRRRYRGDKVDVWSLGVILYAMLCARLPFDDPDIPVLLAKATKGVYEMPEWLSYGSQSLIDKMLQVDPKDRVSTRKIWSQPLVLEYDYLDNLNENGGQPEDIRTNGKCRQVKPEELDMQTLRQLKSMWHTFSEKYLAMKLTSPEPNDQKLFYWLLYSYRLKRLENYDPELTYSSSDFHHLRPANWKKKYTTAEFPSRYGRTPSRFTVISNVATDAAGEALETETDGGATIESYDPYKGSRFLDNDEPASRARIVVHRNGSLAKSSTRTSHVGRMRSGSTRSSSTARGGKHIAVPASMRSSRRSLASFKSGEGTPYQRPASRHKRGVDFSHVRKRSAAPPVNRAVSVAGDEAIYDRERLSTSPKRKTWIVGDSERCKPEQTVQGNKNQRHGGHDGVPLWNEELRQFTYSIAKDCDDAFNSSLLTPDSLTDDAISTTHPTRYPSQDTGSMSIALSTPTPTMSGVSIVHRRDARAWDERPLPAAPAPTDSVLHEIMMARRRAEAQDGKKKAATATGPRCPESFSNSTQNIGDSDRRIVSAPIYSQYSTQWGKDAIPLPSIREGGKEDPASGEPDRLRIVSAPADSATNRSTPVEERKGLDYLAQHENTIRVVTSPSGQPVQVDTPAPLNVRKKLARGSAATQQGNSLNLRQQYQQNDMGGVYEDLPTPVIGNSSGITKKKSWFKRASRDKDDVFNSTMGSGSDNTDQLAYTETNSSTGPAIPPAKKKSFSFAFWRNSKGQEHEPQMQLSIGGNDFEDSPSPEPVRKFNHPARPPVHRNRTDEAALRNIEPQQNWLARLFRVKPATKYLCFAISRRRARQEIAILLKEWRKYGIRDVQVDKERNIVFARVGSKNYLNMKEVAFAAEMMTVIEHGKRNQLSIVRFTQEQGAASSFEKVVDTMSTVFDARSLLVVDQRKAKMMIKTLNS